MSVSCSYQDLPCRTFGNPPSTGFEAIVDENKIARRRPNSVDKAIKNYEEAYRQWQVAGRECDDANARCGDKLNEAFITFASGFGTRIEAGPFALREVDRIYDEKKTQVLGTSLFSEDERDTVLARLREQKSEAYANYEVANEKRLEIEKQTGYAEAKEREYLAINAEDTALDELLTVPCRSIEDVRKKPECLLRHPLVADELLEGDRTKKFLGSLVRPDGPERAA